MKIFKIYIFFLAVVIYFCAPNIMDAVQGQFPDVLRLQPIPTGVHPVTLNKNEPNSSGSQTSEYEFDQSRLDANASYIDTIHHRLFIADTNNNRVFVFNLNSDNVLVDYVPDYVLGQPDFISTDPGTTQSSLNGPTGIAYDPINEKLFVADTNNNRIMVFDVSSITNGENAVNVLGQDDFFSSDPGTDQDSLDDPYSLVYDPVSQVLFVADTNNNRVVTFNLGVITNGESAVNVLGQPDFFTSDSGSAKSEMNSPGGVAYDAGSSKLFVSDINNKRALVFKISSISNGAKADEIISGNNFLSLSPLVAKRMQSSPDENIPIPANGVSVPSSGFPWVIVLLVVVAITAVIFYLVKKKKVV